VCSSDLLNKQVDEGLKQLLAERKLTAIPKDGRVFVVVNDIEKLFENTPSVSLLLPVTSYKEFRESFLTAEERKTFEAGKNGVDEAKVNIFGAEFDVRAQVVSIEGYSAHADQRELLLWVHQFNRTRVQHVFLVHGELGPMSTFKEKLEEAGIGPVDMPERGQSFDF